MAFFAAGMAVPTSASAAGRQAGYVVEASEETPIGLTSAPRNAGPVIKCIFVLRRDTEFKSAATF